MGTPTQLSIYNGALRVLGQAKLSSLTEDREARYVLDEIWDDDGVEACLEQGYWNFAMAAVQISENTDEAAQFGYTYVFDKPSDWVRTAAFCSDEYFSVPILNYLDETDYFFCDVNPVYLKYISNSASYGLNYAGWPESFRKFVHHYFANEAAATIIKNAKTQEQIELKYRKALSDAKNTDAMNEATRFPVQGTLTRARRGGSRGDRGNRGSLTG
jgi:hypothetical protein